MQDQQPFPKVEAQQVDDTDDTQRPADDRTRVNELLAKVPKLIVAAAVFFATVPIEPNIGEGSSITDGA